MARVLLILVAAFSLNKSAAQILSGTWVETSKASPLDFLFLTSTEDIMELSVSADTVLKGIVHSNYSKGRFTHVTVSGVVHWKDSSVILKDVKILDHNINMKVYTYCYGIEFLTLARRNGKYIMTGKRKDTSPNLMRCPTTKTTWEKQVHDTVQSNADRATEIQDLIEIDREETDSIKCSLYDNGEIDDDTVSVFYNDQVILSRQRISANPLDFYISFPKDRRTGVIKMYAENLGRIPPNTAVMIITTKKNRYSINLESNFSNNGSVQLFLKE